MLNELDGRSNRTLIEGAEGTVFYGGGNVFADVGLPDAEELLAKAKIASTINQVMQARNLTQKKAAELMGIDQPKVSKIIRGRLREFSAEWLLARLLRMGMDVDIIIHTNVPDPKREGTIRVATAQ
jgi:predicted XRE-type DNA-binding protein